MSEVGVIDYPGGSLAFFSRIWQFPVDKPLVLGYDGVVPDPLLLYKWQNTVTMSNSLVRASAVAPCPKAVKRVYGRYSLLA